CSGQPEQFQFFLADVNGLDGGAFPDTPVVGDNPLVAIWYGANDVFASLDTLAEVDPTDPAAQAAAAAAALFEATETAKAVANIVGTLADFPLFDFNDFVVLNLPDLGAIPAYNTTPLAGAATQLSTAFNLQLVAELAALEAGGNDIEVIDVFSLIGGLTQGQILPELTNVSEACLVPPTLDDTGNPTSPGSFCGIPNEYAFFDPVHPTTIVHAELSQRVRAAVIPLPATLPLALGALCILSLTGRRFQRS
ncbi:MAG: SGNH/GDSL hydrolase family protein, partial [Pseudomonadota bacterium]